MQMFQGKASCENGFFFWWFLDLFGNCWKLFLVVGGFWIFEELVCFVFFSNVFFGAYRTFSLNCFF